MKRDRLALLDTAEIGRDLMRPICVDAWKQRFNARRYIFDAEASLHIGTMLGECIDLMVDNIEFARAPFPTTYLELDARAMWEGRHPGLASDPHADERVGLLIHNGLALVLASGPVYRTTTDGRGLVQDTIKKAVICGMSFRINRPQTVPFTKLTGRSPALADQCKIGYVFGGHRVHDEHYQVDSLTDKTTVMLPRLPGMWTHEQIAAHFDVMPTYSGTTNKEVIKLSFLGGGDPMLMVTMLLLLGQPSKFVEVEHVGREVGIVRGKRFVFKEHHIVRLKLDRSKPIRAMFHVTDRKSPIGHDVQGHWKHYNRSPDCSHHQEDGRQAWEPVGADRTLDGDYKRYWCPLCLQRRTWTEHFTTAGPGIATTEYAVTR